MTRNNNQIKLIPITGALSSTRLTDTAGNPSESFHWSRMAALRQEWQQEYGLPYVNTLDLSLPEILSIEMRVRRELYP